MSLKFFIILFLVCRISADVNLKEIDWSLVGTVEDRYGFENLCNKNAKIEYKIKQSRFLMKKIDVSSKFYENQENNSINMVKI